MGDLITAAVARAAREAFKAGALAAVDDIRRRVYEDNENYQRDLDDVVDEVIDEIRVGDWPELPQDGA